jgi:phage protein D
MPWIVDWQVSVNGQDMSGSMRPFLTEIEVNDKAGSSADTCSLKLDDSSGVLAFPSEGSQVFVSLMGVPVFQGIVDDTKSDGSRGGGRFLTVNAKGFDTRGKAKEGQSFHKDDSTLDDFLQESAKRAGFSVSVDSSLASKQRSYWAADNESFLGVGEKLAREFNATFKIRGTQAVFVPRNSMLLGPVIGRVGPGGNVINWSISPYTGRGAYTKAKARWFDRKTAKFEEKEIEVGSSRPLPESTNVVRSLAADEAQATDMAEGRKSESERDGGQGSVELDLEPTAQAEGMFTLIGARAGVDGTYRIEGVKHKASRSGGATTGLDLKQPQVGG